MNKSQTSIKKTSTLKPEVKKKPVETVKPVEVEQEEPLLNKPHVAGTPWGLKRMYEKNMKKRLKTKK